MIRVITALLVMFTLVGCSSTPNGVISAASTAEEITIVTPAPAKVEMPRTIYVDNYMVWDMVYSLLPTRCDTKVELIRGTPSISQESMLKHDTTYVYHFDAEWVTAECTSVNMMTVLQLSGYEGIQDYKNAHLSLYLPSVILNDLTTKLIETHQEYATEIFENRANYKTQLDYLFEYARPIVEGEPDTLYLLDSNPFGNLFTELGLDTECTFSSYPPKLEESKLVTPTGPYFFTCKHSAVRKIEGSTQLWLDPMFATGTSTNSYIDTMKENLRVLKFLIREE